MNARAITQLEDLHPAYITDESGKRTSVILPIEAVQSLLDKIANMAEDYELGQLVVERRQHKDQAIRVSLDDL